MSGPVQCLARLDPRHAALPHFKTSFSIKATMATGFGDKAFTMNWLQALTLAAREPIAREIKPLLDTVADISRTTTEADRIASAKKLWTTPSRLIAPVCFI